MFKEAKKYVKKAKSIYIVGHINPDGDAIGSSFALYFALKSIGKNVHVLMPTCSDSFKFLPNISDAKSCVLEESYDLLIAVDSSDKSRLAMSQEDFKKAKKVLMLDHHVATAPYGDCNCIDSSLPAASEIIYNFITYLKIPIDKNIATYLYTGIMTDTGSFNYSSTKPSTLMTASKLVATGIDFADICKRLNHTMKEAKLKLISTCVNNMEVYKDGMIRYAYASQELLSSLGISDEEAEGVTNYLVMIQGCEVAIYVREKSDGKKKVSMRSNGKVDVSKVAISQGGGGHKRAAGYTMYKDYETSKEELINVVEVMLDGTSTN